MFRLCWGRKRASDARGLTNHSLKVFKKLSILLLPLTHAAFPGLLPGSRTSH